MLKLSTYISRYLIFIYLDIWYSYIWIYLIFIYVDILLVWFQDTIRHLWLTAWRRSKKSIQIFGNPNGLILSQLANPSSENILVLLIIMWSWSKSTNILTGKCCLPTLIHSVQSQLYWTAVERSFSCLQAAIINQHWNLLSLHLATILNPFEPRVDLHSLMEKWQTKERESWFLTKFQCIEFDVKVSS